MLLLSRKVEYALMALLHLDGSDEGSVYSSKEIAEQLGLPVDLLGKVMQALARAGLIEAIHGAHGGYRRIRSLKDMFLGEVIEAIEGPVHLVKCQQDADHCVQPAGCSLKEPLQELQESLREFIFAFSLARFSRTMDVAGCK